ncbi:OmpA family protein [bacterium]|nr:OmpA family protein [bacterium]
MRLKFLFVFFVCLVCSLFTHSVKSWADDLGLYVGDTALGVVTVFDPESDTATDTIDVGDEPKGIVALPDASALYVANSLTSDVSVIDPTDNTVSATIDVGIAPEQLVATPDSSTVYVTCSIDDIVYVIDTASNTVTDTIAVGNSPVGIAINPAGTKVYVGNSADSTISVIDTSSNTVTATITLPGGSSPLNLLVNHAGTILYSSNNGTADITEISTSNNTISTTIEVGVFPLGLVLNDDDSLLFVLNSGDNDIDVISTATRTIVETIAVGNFPRQAILNEDETKLYLTEDASGTLGIISVDGLTHTTVAAGNQPYGIAMLHFNNTPTLTVAVSTYLSELYKAGLAKMGTKFHYQVAISNTGEFDSLNTILRLYTPDEHRGNGNILRENDTLEILDGDAGTVTGTIACTPTSDNLTIICDIGTIDAGSTVYFRINMRVGFYNDNGATYQRYFNTFYATVANPDIDEIDTDITFTTAVDPTYPDCTCHVDPSRQFDVGQEIKNTLLMLAFLVLPLFALRLRKGKMLLSLVLMFLLYNSSSMAATDQFSVNPDAPVLGSPGIIYTLGAKKPTSPYTFSFDTQYGYNHLKWSGVSKGLINHLVTHNLGFSFSPKQKLGLDVIVPIVSVNKRLAPSLSTYANKATLGDVLLRGHIPVAHSQSGKTHFALVPYLTIPTGMEKYYVADKYPRGGLIGALDWEMGDKWYSALNVGVEARQSVSYSNYNQKGRILGSIGSAYAVSKQVKLKVDLVGSTAINKPLTHQVSSPLEAMGGVDVELKNHPVSFNVSGGVPLVRGATSPTFRADAGVTVGWGKGEKGLGRDALRALQPTIYFASNSSKISKDDKAKLDTVVSLLKQNPKVKLIVAEGHTDNTGTHKANQKLSLGRANAVKKYLTGKGITPLRIEVSGFADTKPAVSNSNDTGKAKNRRVELRVR